MNKKVLLLLIVTIFFNILNIKVLADYEPPQKIWASFNKYAEAIENNDPQNIIKYGLIDLEILLKEPVNDTTQNWISARYQRIAESYETLGDYENSAKMYEKQIPYAEALGWYDSLKIAKAKVLQYKPSLDLYEKTNQTQKYFGAKNEHEKGVLFGIPVDSELSSKTTSMELLYIEYGDTNFDWEKVVLKRAQRENKAIELALNLPNQGTDIKRILNDTSYMNSIVSLLKEFPDVLVYLRFAAEFDIWENPTDAESFKKAFRKVSDIIHSNLKNTAVVFSPNMVSSWNVDIIDYYPGDEYVDWIGSSLYLMKFFQGVENRPQSEKYLETVFMTGDYADPVLMMKKYVDLFGDRKPIMVSESGASHYVRTVNRDYTPWAENRLKRIYYYLPMVYPEIKLIAHFDNAIVPGVNDYSLKTNSTINKLYDELTSDDVYVTNRNNISDAKTYKKLENTIYAYGNSLDLYAYARVFGNDELTVDYYIDGKWVAGMNEMPYHRVINISNLANGEHTLTVTASNTTSELVKKSYKLIKNSPAQKEIKILINGNELKVNQPPQIINGRTLVPMRAIFEALGAKVTWEDATKTAIGIKSSDEVRISIGKYEIIKNNNSIPIDVPAQLINDKTMVPVRAVAESFNAKVDWIEDERTVMIEI